MLQSSEKDGIIGDKDSESRSKERKLSPEHVRAIERAVNSGAKLEIYALKDRRIKIREVKYCDLTTE